jgi:DASS family divalent anion:Na+ symporter
MAEALGQTGITKRFAEASASLTTGWKWWLALASLFLIYFYAHYVFASITAHVTAMFTPFLIVILAAGAPPYLAVLSLAYFSNLGGIVNALRHDASADLLRRRLHNSTNLVDTRLDYVVDNYRYLEFSGFTWWKILKLW